MKTGRETNTIKITKTMHVKNDDIKSDDMDRIKDFDNIKKSDFDLIFFHTEEYPFKIVQTACFSNWCHIALILVLSESEIVNIRKRWVDVKGIHGVDIEDEKKRIRNVNNDRRVYLLESTTDVYPCVITGRTSNGVKLCLLSNRIPNGDVCGYKRSIKGKLDQTKAKKEILMYEIMPSILNIPYEKNLFKLVKAWGHWLGCLYIQSYDEQSMFCTELVTHILTSLGAMRARHGDLNGDSEYTDEDLTLVDYVKMSKDGLLSTKSWLQYNPIEFVKIKRTCA